MIVFHFTRNILCYQRRKKKKKNRKILHKIPKKKKKKKILTFYQFWENKSILYNLFIYLFYYLVLLKFHINRILMIQLGLLNLVFIMLKLDQCQFVSIFDKKNHHSVLYKGNFVFAIGMISTSHVLGIFFFFLQSVWDPFILLKLKFFLLKVLQIKVKFS